MSTPDSELVQKLRLLAAVAPTWTDYMALKGASVGIYRQCAIGWHEECSDPEGDDCECHCHPHDLWPVEDSDPPKEEK